MLILFNKLCNICINKDLTDSYGLSAKTSIDYCVMDNEPFEIDSLDLVFLICLGTILFLIIVAEVFARKKSNDSLQNFKRTRKLLESYYLRDSLRKLLETSVPSKNSTIVSCQALKVLAMFLFIVSQTYRNITSMPFANPYDVEKVIIIYNNNLV